MKHTHTNAHRHTPTHVHTHPFIYTYIHNTPCLWNWQFLTFSVHCFCMLQVSTVKPTPAILPHDNAHANPPWSVSLSPSSFYWVCLHPQHPHRLLSKLHTVQANEPVQKQPQCTDNEHRTLLSYCTRSSSHTEQATHSTGKWTIREMQWQQNTLSVTAQLSLPFLIPLIQGLTARSPALLISSKDMWF